MWGYIMSCHLCCCHFVFPSLYVRVYRWFGKWWSISGFSLTICEGISGKTGFRLFICSFPHYMWGYIDSGLISWPYRYVPSLYVRVYRNWTTSRERWRSSLTIREGISLTDEIFFICWKFPHYTWGYIACILAFWDFLKVPSLYVRVYRINQQSPP